VTNQRVPRTVIVGGGFGKVGGRQGIQTFASATIVDYMPEAIYPAVAQPRPTASNAFPEISWVSVQHANFEENTTVRRQVVLTSCMPGTS
jgi:hypothetical protein